MKYRKLACTGYDVSVVGFGTWQLGGGRWQARSDEESVQLLQQALELGVNIYDVAVIYGQYQDKQHYLQSRSQELLGQAFSKAREKIIYCVKLGQFDEVSHRHDYDPKRIVEQFRQSLVRLQTDYIDICLVHAPSVEKIRDGKAITVLQTLQALGLVKSIGYSFEAEPEHVLAAVQQPIDVLMMQFNLIDDQCKYAIELARQYGIGVLVGGPYKRGYLTGNYLSVDQLPLADDYWRLNLSLNPGKVEATLAKVNKLLSQYKTPEQLRQAALRHILQEPGAMSCIVGHRSIEEVIENIKITEMIGNDEPHVKIVNDYIKQLTESTAIKKLSPE